MSLSERLTPEDFNIYFKKKLDGPVSNKEKCFYDETINSYVVMKKNYKYHRLIGDYYIVDTGRYQLLCNSISCRVLEENKFLNDMIIYDNFSGVLFRKCGDDKHLLVVEEEVVKKLGIEYSTQRVDVIDRMPLLYDYSFGIDNLSRGGVYVVMYKEIDNVRVISYIGYSSLLYTK